eukprot:CAMPEP_0201872624 /NCGR_PEP_ID=MMETSP0902-20130614/5305_1 /ASSEMBLY_ACC=CAM_ASM_000551 /TAXON_ID=420261 /ORGANISM="Thalassiosira antarctica, Strain CCMP982" /LENGTH=180 /DNA_ID=CAMNT_0048398969 /DNA_START=25 /DNA_END=567 /DNA_ORIENTATION=+
MNTSGYATAAALLLSSPLFALAGLAGSKPDKSGRKGGCNISNLEGSFKLEYDFYKSSDGDYAFSSETAITFEPPLGEGSGVMKANYCFNTPKGSNSNKMVAVQTGFEKDGVIPVKIVKYEDGETVEKIYNEYSLVGEYDCKSKELMIGNTSYFEGNAYGLKMPAKKDDDLDLNESGCLVE